MIFVDTVYDFLRDLKQFDYDISNIDHLWDIIFPDSEGTWNHIHVTLYRKEFYFPHVDGRHCSLEVKPRRWVKVMDSFGSSAFEDGFDNPTRKF